MYGRKRNSEEILSVKQSESEILSCVKNPLKLIRSKGIVLVKYG